MSIHRSLCIVQLQMYSTLYCIYNVKSYVKCVCVCNSSTIMTCGCVCRPSIYLWCGVPKTITHIISQLYYYNYYLSAVCHIGSTPSLFDAEPRDHSVSNCWLLYPIRPLAYPARDNGYMSINSLASEVNKGRCC